MRHILLIFATILLGSGAYAQPGERKIQVAILFDTSNSMDGLIDQAKSRIWSIVNEVGELTYNRRTPTIQFAIFQYGNDGLPSKKNYIELVMDFTSDLDDVSKHLFGLRTNGGSEYCGAVLGESLKQLDWSNNSADLKMIYIAGNERFDQGPIDFKQECKKAVAKEICITTVYCGDYDQGVRELWKEGADCNGGHYFNIDSNREIVHIETPYDEEISIYNDSLNSTYFGYGNMGLRKKQLQVSEDANAASMDESVKTERVLAKSKKATYSNSSWDLIDAVDEGERNIEDMKEEELPEEFKNKTPEERKALLDEKRAEREKYQKRIAELGVEREAFIAEEMKKRASEGEVDDFGTSVNKSILENANKIGYKKEAVNEE